ncbi:MAG: tetratricopeptide repeat protein [Nitrospiraceae bacterium]|nr:tetratricopeptide repeat protein [Nitrospiraceae bacterium]
MNTSVWLRAARCAVVALLASLPVFADLSGARTAMDTLRAEQAAALEAQIQNDQTGFATHQTAAQAALREACALFKAAGASDSGDAGVLRDYAEALQYSGDLDLSAGLLAKAAQLTPEDAEAWLSYGRVLAALGDSKAADAAQALRRVVELAPDMPTGAAAYAILARLYDRQGLYALARECAEKAIAIDPANQAARLAMAAADIRSGRVREAGDTLDALGPLSPELAQKIPSILADSLRGMARSRHTFADTADNHLAYAKILFRIGRMQEALLAAERAAELKEDNYVAHNLVGSLSRQLGRSERARQAFERSLELNPNQPRTREALQALAGDL